MIATDPRQHRQIIDLMARTLREVEANPMFQMMDFSHPCGTPACISGHMSHLRGHTRMACLGGTYRDEVGRLEGSESNLRAIGVPSRGFGLFFGGGIWEPDAIRRFTALLNYRRRQLAVLEAEQGHWQDIPVGEARERHIERELAGGVA